MTIHTLHTGTVHRTLKKGTVDIDLLFDLTIRLIKRWNDCLWAELIEKRACRCEAISQGRPQAMTPKTSLHGAGVALGASPMRNRRASSAHPLSLGLL